MEEEFNKLLATVDPMPSKLVKPTPGKQCHYDDFCTLRRLANTTSVSQIDPPLFTNRGLKLVLTPIKMTSFLNHD